jgi:hypothetical protein
MTSQHHATSVHCCIAPSCIVSHYTSLKTHHSIHNKINSGTNQHISLPYNVLALNSHLQGEGLISVKVMNLSYPTPNEAACYTLLEHSLMLMYFLPNGSINPLLFVHYTYAFDLFLSNKTHEDFSFLGCDSA